MDALSAVVGEPPAGRGPGVFGRGVAACDGGVVAAWLPGAGVLGGRVVGDGLLGGGVLGDGTFGDAPRGDGGVDGCGRLGAGTGCAGPGPLPRWVGCGGTGGTGGTECVDGLTGGAELGADGAFSQGAAARPDRWGEGCSGGRAPGPCGRVGLCSRGSSVLTPTNYPQKRSRW